MFITAVCVLFSILLIRRAQDCKSLHIISAEILLKIVSEHVVISTLTKVFICRYVTYIDKDGEDQFVDVSSLCCFGVIHAVLGFTCDDDQGLKGFKA